jgi:tetratricopeptide (TPR) repeat protein
MLEAALQKGQTQVEQGHYDPAIATLNGYITANAKTAAAFRWLGDAQRGKNDFNNAQTSYKKALALQAQYPEALLGLSICYYVTQNYPEALNQVNAALKIKSDYTDAYLSQGYILLATNKADEAFKSFQQALKYDPNNAIAYTNIADIYRSRGQDEVAIQNYVKAIQFNPNDPQTHYQLGLLYAKKDPDQAIGQLQIAVQQRQEWPEAWYSLGKLYEQKARETDAEAALNNALKYKDKFSQPAQETDTHYELGMVLLSENRLDEALQQYQTAITQAQARKSDYLPAWYQEGTIYESKGDLVKAKEAYTRVLNDTQDATLKKEADTNLRRINGQ